MTNAPSSRPLRRIFVAAGLAISAAGVALLPSAGWPGLIESLRGVDPVWFLLAATAGFASNAMRALRWSLILADDAPVVRCAAAALAGLAMNNLLPLRAGDAIRGAAFSGRDHTAPAHGLSAVALERLLDLSAVGVLAAVSAAILDLPGWPLAGGLALVLIISVSFIGCASVRFQAWADVAGWRRQIGLAAQGFAAMRSRRRLPLIAGLTTLAWVVEVLAIWAACLAIGWQPTAVQAAWVCAAGTLAMALPGAPGGIGSVHAALAWAAIAIGAEASNSTALAVTIHAALWLPVTLAGLACLPFVMGRQR